MERARNTLRGRDTERRKKGDRQTDEERGNLNLNLAVNTEL